TGVNKYNDKWIALEAHAGAKLMSNENYTSALLMKDRNVRNAHVEMAMQQLEIQKRYSDFINRMGWSFVPHADAQEQVKTYQHFYIYDAIVRQMSAHLKQDSAHSLQ